MISKKLPILVVIPHCSFHVPKAIAQNMQLSDQEIKEESDLYTDQLFQSPQTYNLFGKVSRLVSDYNRAPDHIEMEHMLAHDGVVVSVNEKGKPVYKNPPSIEQIQIRIDKYHHPFHQEIDRNKPKIKFIIDAHSLLSRGPIVKEDAGQERADIVLGNRDYTTCSRSLTFFASRFFQDLGYSVKINDPYGGKYILGHHCSRAGLNGLQVEINRRLYMNEKSLLPLKRNITKINKQLITFYQKLTIELECIDL